MSQQLNFLFFGCERLSLATLHILKGHKSVLKNLNCVNVFGSDLLFVCGCARARVHS